MAAKTSSAPRRIRLTIRSMAIVKCEFAWAKMEFLWNNRELVNRVEIGTKDFEDARLSSWRRAGKPQHLSLFLFSLSAPLSACVSLSSLTFTTRRREPGPMTPAPLAIDNAVQHTTKIQVCKRRFSSESHNRRFCACVATGAWRIDQAERAMAILSRPVWLGPKCVGAWPRGLWMRS